MFRVLLIVAYHLGLRRSELAHLRWSAVDFNRNVLHVEGTASAGERTKNRKVRTLPMPLIVQDELRSLYQSVPLFVERGQSKPKHPHCFTWENGDPLLPDWITHEFARVAKRSKIEHCSIHDLRRSFSTLAQRAGVDKVTVKDLGGWSTVQVLEKHYTGETPEVFRRAMRVIEASKQASA